MAYFWPVLAILIFWILVEVGEAIARYLSKK